MRFALLLAALLSWPCHADIPWPPLRDPPPAWLKSPSVFVDVQWTRKATSPPFLYGGVCHLFYADDEIGREAAEDQVNRCVLQARYQDVALTVLGPPKPGTRRVQIHYVDGLAGVDSMWNDLFIYKLGKMPAGFYFEMPGSVCLVVMDEHRYVLGHELKHCFDGQWHSFMPGHM